MSSQTTVARNTRISIRVDGELKKEAEGIFAKIGLNLTDGINVYLHRVVADKGIPFQLVADREHTLVAAADDIKAKSASSDLAAATEAENLRELVLVI